jgi:hypothetical protein
MPRKGQLVFQFPRPRPPPSSSQLLPFPSLPLPFIFAGVRAYCAQYCAIRARDPKEGALRAILLIPSPSNPSFLLVQIVVPALIQARIGRASLRVAPSPRTAPPLEFLNRLRTLGFIKMPSPKNWIEFSKNCCVHTHL